jgi:hypothetical protein
MRQNRTLARSRQSQGKADRVTPAGFFSETLLNGLNPKLRPGGMSTGPPMLPGIAAWIEAAAPLPLRGGVGIADAPRDGADMNVTVIVPSRRTSCSAEDKSFCRARAV